MPFVGIVLRAAAGPPPPPLAPAPPSESFEHDAAGACCCRLSTLELIGAEARAPCGIIEHGHKYARLKVSRGARRHNMC